MCVHVYKHTLKKRIKTHYDIVLYIFYAPENLIGVISAGSRMATGLADPTAMGPDPGWLKPGGKMAMLTPLQKNWVMWVINLGDA